MNHDLIPEIELRGKAEADCRDATKALSPAPPRVDALRSTTEWDPEELRHVYEFAADLWLDGFAFDVVLDEAGRAVGFTDESKWRACDWRPFPRSRIVPLAAQTGLVPDTAVVIGYAQGPRGELDARLLSDPRSPASRRFRLKINPVLEKIISLTPEEIEP